MAEGTLYIGSSAGSIVAGPIIKTTKDMPIVQPPSFDSLSLVSFQISPHYLDPDPTSTPMGETQEERINQFLEENEAPVAGLREGTMLRIEGQSIILKGVTNARIFRKGHAPREIEPGHTYTTFSRSGRDRRSCMKLEGTLLLNRSHVMSLTRLDECTAAVEEAFKLYAIGKIPSPETLGAYVPEGGILRPG